MRGSPHRFRDFVLALDLAANAAILLVLFVTLFFIHSSLSSHYFAARQQDMEKIRLLLEDHLRQAREELQLFIGLPESEREKTNRSFLRSFSDIYRFDDEFRIEKIYLSTQKNRLFVGYSFSQGRLRLYLDRSDRQESFSEIMAGLEDERPSIYYSAQTSNERFLARVNISYLTALLEKVTKFSGMPIMLLARDGFVITSTAPELGISTLNHYLGSAGRGSLSAGGRWWRPIIAENPTADVLLAMLVPLRALESLRSILLISALMSVAVLVSIALFKRKLTERLMLAPLSAFADRLRSFGALAQRPARPTEDYRFDELSLLDRRFTEMAHAISDREESLRSALKELEESRSFTVQAVDGSRQFFTWLTPQGILRYANSTSLAMVGAALEDVAEKPFWEAPWFSHDPKEQEKLKEAILRVSSGKTARYELVVCSLEGAPRLMDFSLHPVFDAAGSVFMLVAAAMDITDRKEAEAEKARLEARNMQLQKAESLSRMAGAIAHNYNNLLFAVTGNLELARYAAPSDAEVQGYIDKAHTAALRATEISSLMLTYIGETADRAQSLDLVQVLTDLLEPLGKSLPKNVRLRAELPPIGAVVKANKPLLKVILTNLVSNASEAIGDQEGRIDVALRLTDREEILRSNFFPLGWNPTAASYACISVADTGCGMDEATQNNIFDPYFTTKFVGRGLGLSAVLGMLRVVEGAIRVESLPEHGTTVKVFLPVVEVKTTELPDAAAPDSTPARRNDQAPLADDKTEKHDRIHTETQR